MKLAIRDDDTCYFTEPSELERVYHDVWDRVPVCLATVPFASAKSYHVSLSTPSEIGSTQLPAGDYSVKLEGNNAVLTQVGTDKTYQVPVKVDTENRKFEQNAVVTDSSNGTSHVKSIELGGSKTRLDFSE